MLLLVLVLIFTLLCSLFLIGRFTSTKKELSRSLSLQMEVFSEDMTSYWDKLAAMNITLSSGITTIVDNYLEKEGITFSEMADDQSAISSLEVSVLDPLCQYLRQTSCSGAFILFDTTVNNHLSEAPYSKSGLYIQKSNFNVSDPNLLLYRGIAKVGKDHKIMPHRKWRQEFTTTLFPDYEKIQENATLPLESTCYITDLETLPGTSEPVVLVTVPLLGKDDTYYGLCGFEVSQSYFKAEHAQSSNLKHMVCFLTPDNLSENPSSISSEKSLQTGIRNGYYFTLHGDFSVKDFGNGLLFFSNGEEDYIGMGNELTLTQRNNPFFAAVMVPKSDYDHSLQRYWIQTILLILLILFFAIVSCIHFSRRFLAPILKGLEQIREDKASRSPSHIPEIDDLLDFLSEKDEETEQTILQLQAAMAESRDALASLSVEQNTLQQQYDAMQEELSRLTKDKKKEVDPDEYQHFLDCLDTLTAKENFILELYTQGKSSKEILSIANITENTLKYHNRNIYSKLGVKSRKQLLMYMTLMKQNAQ